ncbi:YbbR-like protein [Lutibacter oricola]|uniref:YbbR-like protein n=1 Tax=Lutibacter oricola TaxID=762486 RepID=A0A1H2W9B8_9FLAO|nr:CdaR family protein [Lutibacter oricola]SDW77137.1 YbbR-like protein [Lutibacter oricola]
MKNSVINSNFAKLNNRKVKVFLFFLVLTSIIWLLVELSKTYKSKATFEVNYINVPNNLLLQKAPDKELVLDLKALGFSLLKYKLSKKELNLNLSHLRENTNGYYLLVNNQKSYLSAQLKGDVEVLNVLQDTLYLDFGKKIFKKIPVELVSDLTFKLGYNFVNNIHINPDSVSISGPKKHIDSIQKITTTLFTRNDIYQNINETIGLNLPVSAQNVEVSAKSVKITGKVDKFTEGSFKIPVSIINKPVGVEINPFPKEIEISYQAGLENFSKITKNSVHIVFDYNEYKNDTLTNFLTPVVKQQSEFISTLKISPTQIEFLIQQQ